MSKWILDNSVGSFSLQLSSCLYSAELIRRQEGKVDQGVPGPTVTFIRVSHLGSKLGTAISKVVAWFLCIIPFLDCSLRISNGRRRHVEQDLGISESLAIKSLISHSNSLLLLEIESRTVYWLGFSRGERSHFSYLTQEKNKGRK